MDTIRDALVSIFTGLVDLMVSTVKAVLGWPWWWIFRGVLGFAISGCIYYAHHYGSPNSAASLLWAVGTGLIIFFIPQLWKYAVAPTAGYLWGKFIDHFGRVCQWVFLAIPLGAAALIGWWYIYDYDSWASTPPFNFMMGIISFVLVAGFIGMFQEIKAYLDLRKRWLLFALVVIFTALCITWFLTFNPKLLIVLVAWIGLMALVFAIARKRDEFCNWVVLNPWRFVFYVLATVVFAACLIQFGPFIEKFLWSIKWWVIGISTLLFILVIVINNWDSIKDWEIWEWEGWQKIWDWLKKVTYLKLVGLSLILGLIALIGFKSIAVSWPSLLFFPIFFWRLHAKHQAGQNIGQDLKNAFLNIPGIALLLFLSFICLVPWTVIYLM